MKIKIFYKFKRGITLVELIMGILVLSIITLVLFEVITNSMAGYNRGRVAAQARENARQAIDRISQELRQGVPIPFQRNGRSVPSPVLSPNAYTETLGINLIVFSQVTSTGSLDTKQLSQYRYIVYRVNQTQTNTLERLIYNVDDGFGAPQGLTLDTITGRWGFNPALLTAPIGNAVPIVALPQTADTIVFTLTHQAVANTQSQILNFDPGKVLLDPLFYTLTVTVRQFDPNELKKAVAQRKPITIDLTSTVRIEGLSN